MEERLLDLRPLSIWATLGLFALASVVVWFAAVRVTRYAGAISRKTGLGQGFVGMVFLALATSLPELGATTTASLSGNAPIAANNLLGGVALQTAVLAVADAAAPRALTSRARRGGLLLQGGSLVLLLAFALTGIAMGGRPQLADTSVWTLAIAAAYLGSMVLVRRVRRRGRPAGGPAEPAEAPSEPREDILSRYVAMPTFMLASRFALGAVLILVGGSVLASSADAIAANTGLAGGFVGGTLLAVATSLPEVGTTVQAARLGLETMAISNIFGSNAVDVFLLLVADVSFARGSVLGQVGADSIFLAAVGISVTVVYLLGILQRRNRTLGRMGVDSIVVVALYLAGVFVLYIVR